MYMYVQMKESERYSLFESVQTNMERVDLRRDWEKSQMKIKHAFIFCFIIIPVFFSLKCSSTFPNEQTDGMSEPVRVVFACNMMVSVYVEQ